MLCVECNQAIKAPALVVAMEQRDHFALQRHVQVCEPCAERMYRHVDEAIGQSRNRSQSVNCCVCGHSVPAMRLRFELRNHPLHAVALCGGCYGSLREKMLKDCSNFIAFVDLEWETHQGQGQNRMPWPKGTKVKVRHHVPRFHDMSGEVRSARGLVHPYFGYDIWFDGTHHHFFHERDLEPQGLSQGRPGEASA